MTRLSIIAALIAYDSKQALADPEYLRRLFFEGFKGFNNQTLADLQQEMRFRDLKPSCEDREGWFNA